MKARTTTKQDEAILLMITKCAGFLTPVITNTTARVIVTHRERSGFV